MPPYDVVVAGLGGFGSSAAAHLAARGLRVLGIDPRPPVHTEGSSHGETRIVRQVYFEGSAYVPLLRRSVELWDAMADASGAALFRRTGAVFLGRPESRVFAGSLATAREWDLEHEVLDAREVNGRFPAMRPPADIVGLLEPSGGLVSPELAVEAHLRRAAAAGADLVHDEHVSGWTVHGERVTVTTTRGSHDVGALVLAPGRWVADLLGGADLPLRVERRVQHWFAPTDPRDFRPDRAPVWIWDRADGSSLYGTPAVDGCSVKAAVHFSTDRAADSWTPEELAQILCELFPSLGDSHRRAAECWYTLTPDEHFVVGPHPESARVVLACGFSGHGFKFTPVLGEVLADLVVDGSTGYDLSTFDPRRFASRSAGG